MERLMPAEGTRVFHGPKRKKKHKKQPDAANQAASFEFPYANYKKKIKNKIVEKT